MSFLHPQLINSQKLLPIPHFPLLANTLLLHNGVHPEISRLCLLEPRNLVIVEAFLLVLLVTLESKVAGVSVRVPLVARLVITRAAELFGFNVDVNAAGGEGESLVEGEGLLLAALLGSGRYGFSVSILQLGIEGDLAITAEMGMVDDRSDGDMNILAEMGVMFLMNGLMSRLMNELMNGLMDGLGQCRNGQSRERCINFNSVGGWGGHGA
mmetsp:Transcript_31509/g.58186  ORF Transcript_31509/g.58186 Transcript_31509/m.58186 type:complete len:211 (+) Transcript_31509:359-991(+)